MKTAAVVMRAVCEILRILIIHHSDSKKASDFLFSIETESAQILVT